MEYYKRVDFSQLVRQFPKATQSLTDKKKANKNQVIIIFYLRYWDIWKPLCIMRIKNNEKRYNQFCQTHKSTVIEKLVSKQ